MQRRKVALLVIDFTALQHLKNLLRNDVANQSPCVIGSISSRDQSFKGLSCFWRCILAELRIDHIKNRGGEGRIGRGSKSEPRLLGLNVTSFLTFVRHARISQSWQITQPIV